MYFFTLSFVLPHAIGLNNGELSQGFLLQQLNNPNVNQRDREMLFTALGHFNATSSAPENNKQHPVLPNNVRTSKIRYFINKHIVMYVRFLLISFCVYTSHSDADAECKFAAKYADTQ